MESYLKTKTVRVEHLGKDFDIRELPAGAWIELMELHRNNGQSHSAALVCKHGVIGWGAESIETIEASLPVKVMQELASAIYDLSGVDAEKNSESVPKEGSSSVSLRSLG